MRFSTSLALAALGLAASALPAAAGTLLVPQQFPTIQSALNASRPYDTVLVSAKPKGGVYSEAVTISTPHVTLQGRSNPVIDGSKLGTVVHFLPGYPQFDYTVFPNGVQVRADHVAVCGLTVQGFASASQGATSSGIDVSESAAGTGFSDAVISGDTLRNDEVGLTIAGYSGGNPYFYGGGTYLKGYQVLGNTITGNTQAGATISGASILVVGNKFSGNGTDGLDAAGLGVTVSGNEAGGNAFNGIQVIDTASTYNPAVNDPNNPNPAPTVTAFNYVHDNGDAGLYVVGTQAVSGNLVSNSAYYGIYLSYADYSTVSANLVSGSGETGIYADYSAAFYGADSGLKISLNQISGGSGDGIYFNEIAGGVISLNNVVGNQGIGIHLSDYTSDYGYNDYAPTTVTQNRAQHNTVFDARDDASAPDDINDNGNYYYGDGGYYGPTNNVWTKNVFGTTDPVGLSK